MPEKSKQDTMAGMRMEDTAAQDTFVEDTFAESSTNDGNPSTEESSILISIDSTTEKPQPVDIPDIPGSDRPTPLPWMQLLVLSIVIFAEPVSLTILYPFLVPMIQSFHVTEDERQIGFYAGFVAASFSLAQFITSLPWGWISFRVGTEICRRPVILVGLLGNVISAILFGLSRSYTWAVLSRTLAGLLNGNVATAKCMVGELTDRSNQSRAFTLFGLAFGVGCLVAPTLGGILAEPAKKFPRVFGYAQVWSLYPYLLPCLVSASVSLFGLLVGFVYLKETLPTKREHRLTLSAENAPPSAILYSGDIDGQPSETLPLLSTDLPTRRRRPSYRASATCILAYSFLALTQIIYQEAFVLWCNTQPALGGLGWGSTEVGIAMASTGAVLLLVQLQIYPWVQRYVGNLTIFTYAMFLHVPMFLVTGCMRAALDAGPEVLWTVISIHGAVRTLLQSLAFTTAMILVNNSATPGTLSTVNGISQASASLVRAVGPALAGYLWSFSLTNGHPFPLNFHFVFLLVSLISFVGWMQAKRIPKQVDAPEEAEQRGETGADTTVHV